MIYVILIFSFYLEGLLSRININLLATLLSIILIYPYLYNKKKYYVICFILGLIYDIAYTNTGILNACLFLFIGYLIHILNIYITNNWFNEMIIGIVIIMLYRILTYFVLIFIDYLEFDINVLINSIIYSLFSIIYIILMYIVINIIAKKLRIFKKK